MTQTIANIQTSFQPAYLPLEEDAEAARNLIIATLKTCQAQADLLYAQTSLLSWFGSPFRLSILDREVLHQGRCMRRLKLFQTDGGAAGESVTFTFHEDGTMDVVNTGIVFQENLPRLPVSIDRAMEAVELYLLRALGSQQNVDRLRMARLPNFRLRA